RGVLQRDHVLLRRGARLCLSPEVAELRRPVRPRRGGGRRAGRPRRAEARAMKGETRRMNGMRPTAVTDIGSFWKAVGVRAVGAAIVTAEAADGPRGFLALSATHLCASPPTMMVSI